MEPVDDFPDLIRRIRAGDPDAAATLVRQYEPEIRRTIRVRLRDNRLRRLLDSMDFCQSVLGNFFARVAVGQFDIDQPDQVLKLLVTMAHNKLNDQARRHHAQRRDARRQEVGTPELLAEQPDNASSPSQIVAGRELLELVRQELTEEERFLADQRALGRDWADIAVERGGTPDQLRMKLHRAIERVTEKLDL